MNADYIIEHYFNGEKTVDGIKQFFKENKFKLSDEDADKLYKKYFKKREIMKIDISNLLLKNTPNFKKGEHYCMSVTGKVGIARKVGYVLKAGYKPNEWERYQMDNEFFDLYNGPQALTQAVEIQPASFIYSWTNQAKKEELPDVIPFPFLVAKKTSMADTAQQAIEWNYNVKKPENPTIPKYCVFFCCPLWKLEEIVDFENKYQQAPWIVKSGIDTGYILRDSAIKISLYKALYSDKNYKTFPSRSEAVKWLTRDVNWAIDEFTTNIDDIKKTLRNAKFRVSNETPEMVSVNKGMKLGVKYTAHSQDVDYDFVPQSIDEHGFYRTADGLIIDEGIQANTSVINQRLTKAYGKVMSYRYIANTNIVDRHTKKVEEMIEDFDNLDETRKQYLVKYVKIIMEKVKEI